MSLDNLEENNNEYDNSLRVQLGLFSSDNNEYIQSIKKSVDDFLSRGNLIFANKDTEFYLIESNKDWNTIKSEVVFKLIQNDEIKYFQLKISIDMLKKYIYINHKWTKWMEWIKANLPFMMNKEDILWFLIDPKEENFEDYHLVTKKPRDIVKKEVQKNPETNFSDTKIEINWEETTIMFHLNWYNFRVTRIETSVINQRNWGINDDNELINFNKLCLNNIGIYLDDWADKAKWKWFTWSFNFYEFYRSEISKHIFNELNSYKYKELLEKTI